MTGRRRIIAWAMVVAWATAIFAVSNLSPSDLPATPGPVSYLAHFSEYLVLGALLVTALTGHGRRIAVVVALVVASAYGASDEFHQSFVAGRQPDPLDWLCDTAGAAVGVWLADWLWRRRTTEGLSHQPPDARPGPAPT